jgi:hypothetical protein
MIDSRAFPTVVALFFVRSWAVSMEFPLDEFFKCLCFIKKIAIFVMVHEVTICGNTSRIYLQFCKKVGEVHTTIKKSLGRKGIFLRKS